jgi:hypothetical protein
VAIETGEPAPSALAESSQEHGEASHLVSIAVEKQKYGELITNFSAQSASIRVKRLRQGLQETGF